MGICLRYANSKPDASSIMNEGFLKVFMHIKTYDFNRPFTAWISRIMTNTAIDYYRTNLRFSNNEDLHDHQYLPISIDAIHDKLNYQDLLLMIQSLSPSCRTVFNLYAIEGYSHEEIAGMLNISIGTSKSNLYKARAKLMEKLKAAEAEAKHGNTITGSISKDVDFND
ncbi:RNA polymerase sigma factor [Olivibacter sp. SDN3]|nr:RNA polymerase sigma factor [Olivibacter sp. SDN3]